MNSTRPIAIRTSVYTKSGADYARLMWTDPATGKRRTEAIGRMGQGPGRITKTQLRDLALKRQAELNGDPRSRREASGLTVADWLDEFERLIERDDLAPTTRRGYAATTNRLADALGDHRLDSITPADAEAFVQSIAGRPYTRRTHLVRARTIFDRAVDLGHITENPFARVRARVPRITREVVDLAEEDVAKLIEHAPSPGWARAIALAAYAGLRVSQIERLEWKDVKLDGRRILVRPPEGKNTTKEHPHAAKIEPELLAVLKAAESRNGLVADVDFGNVRRTLYGGTEGKKNPRTYVGVAERAGIEPWADKPMHSLRAWCSVWLKGRGYPKHVVDAWLGHSGEVASQHYEYVPEHFYTGETELEGLRRRVAELEAENAELRKRVAEVCE